MNVGWHRTTIARSGLQPSAVKQLALNSSAFSSSFWRMAILAAAGAIGASSSAQAAIFWSDSAPGLSAPKPVVAQRRPNPKRHVGKKNEVPEREAAKPQGPLIIAISIDKQRLKVYDVNGFYAETPISTGMRGHPTPMGVFSIIQKHKLHHSNIYSGAPMPFMQRITWSGVAMHAGVLPGYPASHGCIRMPMAFAVKMWGWTKMGARVVVTPGEITPPADFSHPLLAAQKVAPQQTAAAEPTPLREPTRTADAGGTPVTMSDAGGGAVPPRQETTVRTDRTPSTPENAATVRADAAPDPVAMSEAVKPESEPAAAKPSEPVVAQDKPAEASPSEAAPAETSPAETAQTKVSETVAPKPDEAALPAPAGGDAVRTEAAETVKSAETKVELKAEDVKITPSAETVIVPEVKKDQARLPDAEKPPAAKPVPAIVAAPPSAPKRTGQIAVFVSRKDSKLYVRQNFAPLFDIPVTIAPSDRPLGTHVFTAQVDKDDANVLHWSVVSLPARNAERRDEDERVSRRRKIAGAAVEVKPMPVPDSPTEALDRLGIPADAMARITDALSTGGSIIVSDQGITAGETGEGTDFIVSLR
jgi:lipoprotein-anchoring transpeptidase ErfK/SrfK